MSKFAIDEDEMDDLGKGLDSLSEVYDDVETPCPVPAFGHPTLDEAYREFADAATERIGGLSDWCEETSEAVSDTSQMAEETDGEWAKQFMSQVQKFQ